MSKRPTVLMILDGYGLNKKTIIAKRYMGKKMPKLQWHLFFDH